MSKSHIKHSCPIYSVCNIPSPSLCIASEVVLNVRESVIAVYYYRPLMTTRRTIRRWFGYYTRCFDRHLPYIPDNICHSHSFDIPTRWNVRAHHRCVVSYSQRVYLLCLRSCPNNISVSHTIPAWFVPPPFSSFCIARDVNPNTPPFGTFLTWPIEGDGPAPGPGPTHLRSC